MSTNRIFEKAEALNTGSSNAPKREERKRKGVWSELETFEDKSSGIAVVITERMRGKPGYSFQIVHFDDHGGNKFVPLPCPGANRPIEEVVYLLVKKAREFIEEKQEAAKKRESRAPRKDRRDDKKRGDYSQASGLSALAKSDAQKQGKGDEFVGKSEKKKSKKVKK